MTLCLLSHKKRNMNTVFKAFILEMKHILFNYKVLSPSTICILLNHFKKKKIKLFLKYIFIKSQGTILSLHFLLFHFPI